MFVCLFVVVFFLFFCRKRFNVLSMTANRTKILLAVFTFLCIMRAAVGVATLTLKESSEVNNEVTNLPRNLAERENTNEDITMDSSQVKLPTFKVL